jgi:hypothetical protein
MNRPGKQVFMLGAMAGLWVALMTFQYVTFPEAREVPLTFKSGQTTGTTMQSGRADEEFELRPIRILARQLSSTPTRNIFAPIRDVDKGETVAKVRATKIKRKGPPEPAPALAVAAVPAPLLPSPEELAEQAAQQQRETKLRQLRELMGQYRYLGYVTQAGEQKAFLGRANDIYIIRQGDTLDGQFRVTSIAPTAVTIHEPQLNLEATLQLKAESAGNAS